MRKYIIFICLAVLLFTTSAALGFVQPTKEELQHLKIISDKVVEGCNSLEEKVIKLQEFLNRPDDSDILCKYNWKPLDSKITVQTIWHEMTISEWLESGYAAKCDQLATAYAVLAALQGIPTRIVFLHYRSDGVSRHAIAESLIDERWAVVDPLFNPEMRNRNNLLVTRNDLRKDFEILLNAPPMKRRLEKTYNNNRKEWLDFCDQYINELAVVQETYTLKNGDLIIR